jgi:hypothetical protein
MVKKTVIFTESIQHLNVINDKFNDLLLLKLKEAEDKNYVNKVSNVFGVQTKNIMCDEIFQFTKILMRQCLEDLFVGHKTKYIINNFWINKNTKGSFNRSHVHAGCHFSAVYYVKAPENCGNIVFTNPNLGARMHGFDSINNEKFRSQWSLKPEKGLFILFPSYIPHEVEPNQSDEERISASFNVEVTVDNG